MQEAKRNEELGRRDRLKTMPDGRGQSAAAPRHLPASLLSLVALALDLRWTCSHAADALWRTIDPEIWEATRNPWFLLQNASAARLQAVASDASFVNALQRLDAARRHQLDRPSWCASHAAGFERHRVGYFSMEFGLGEAVPLYAGGLGILAGDFLKTANDLGLPLVGVGILFQEGYFRQRLEPDGWQEERYPYNEPGAMPLQPVIAQDGAWLRIPLEIDGRVIWLRAWLASVGRVSLYLLDANHLLNNPADRGITAKLYGGGSETRLLQELVLGVGGWRLLEALELRPSIAHLNEGHAAFVVLERARSFQQRTGLSFREALWATRIGNVFTSHTPVGAGFDRFDPRLIERNLLSSKGSFRDVGLPPRALLGMGRRLPEDDTEPFNMAYLAMRGCAFANGVSRLHGEVSRDIFSPLFPGWPRHEVPIGHVTNGVHVSSWDSRAADELWTEACGKERWRRSVEGLDHIVSSLSDERLWSMRSTQRAELVGQVRERLRAQLLGRGVLEGDAIAAQVFDPSVLTLGFARRFAEYKRPTLLLRDSARLARLLSNPLRPVQIVVAGKAHPDDENGKRMIAQWLRFADCPDMRRRVVFLEDYDIGLAAQLTQGVDVWVNTPRRPWEACGTSGMKVLVNGGLDLSVRDGWWAEVDASDVGWGLGDAAAPCDAADAEQLYAILESAVVPEFYQRDRDGLPRRWIARIRASMSRLAPRFSANRMLSEYMEQLYLPAGAGQARRAENDAQIARSLARWEHLVTSFWHAVRFGAVEHERLEGGGVRFRTWISSGEVPLDCVRVELYADATRDAPAFCEVMTAHGHGHPDSQCFELDVVSTRPVTDFTPRILPHHPDARLPFELPLIRWQR